MYDQKIEDGISKRKGSALPTAGARITIVPYRNLVSAEIRAQTPGATEALSLTLKSTIMKDVDEVSEVMYDAVVCATGYERHSWANLLKSSNLGRRFGLSSMTSSSINLAVERDLRTTTNGTDGHSHVACPDLKNDGSGMLRTSQAARNILTSLRQTRCISRDITDSSQRRVIYFPRGSTCKVVLRKLMD